MSIRALRWLGVAVCGAAVCTFASCSKPVPSTTRTSATPAAAKSVAEAAVQVDESDADATSSDATIPAANDVASAESNTAVVEPIAAADAAAGEETSIAAADAVEDPAVEPATGGQKIVLGDPSLTAGIPGDGPLALDEIQSWLDDPRNHEPLDFDLPLGLAAGAAAVVGVDENPLTRAKIELGRQLYFDPRLSYDQTVSCASCHHPDTGYARPTRFGVGINGQEGGRNSPVSYNRILSAAQFWDGRAASLEEQAVGPIANPIEMGNNHDACVECLAGIPGYRLQFERIFGEATIDAVAMAIASFERAIVTGPAPFDYREQLRPYEDQLAALGSDDPEDLKEEDPEIYEAYLAALAQAEEHPMSESAERGRVLYFSEKASCSACHVGPNLTDEKYHNLGVGMDAAEPDLGRFVVTGEEKDKGAFKTPTIRNVALTAPYMHDGSQKTLEEVVEWYAKGGHPNPYLSDKIKKLDLTPQDKQDLVEFMKACTGEFPPVETERLPE